MRTEERQHLRRTLRHARNALSQHEQQRAAEQLCHQAIALPAFSHAKKVAAYLPNDGEISLEPLIKVCRTRDIRVNLPVLHPFSKTHLLFLNYSETAPLTANRFGIPEPVLDATQVCPVSQLDIILMPLVGFDARGNRLGMGGGFYDRTLAHIQSLPTPPLLIGTAHDCQEVPALPVEEWDVPLDGILTPSRYLSAK